MGFSLLENRCITCWQSTNYRIYRLCIHSIWESWQWIWWVLYGFEEVKSLASLRGKFNIIIIFLPLPLFGIHRGFPFISLSVNIFLYAGDIIKNPFYVIYLWQLGVCPVTRTGCNYVIIHHVHREQSRKRISENVEINSEVTLNQLYFNNQNGLFKNLNFVVLSFCSVFKFPNSIFFNSGFDIITV